MSKLKYQPYRAQEGRATLCLLLALAAALCGVFLTLATQKKTALPYAQTQLKAAERMAEAERALYDYVRQNDIPIEKDDLNDTGLIGPEWTELTTSLGLLEAKRTALRARFCRAAGEILSGGGAATGRHGLHWHERLISGAWQIASIAAANEMGLNVRVIASYGASMYGATRTALPIVRILDVARQAGLIEYDMLAVSPGGDFDQGYNLIYPNSREVIFALAREAGLTMIDEETIPASIQRRLAIYGDDVDRFVNVGGASANMGTSPYTLTFPNGLVLDPPGNPRQRGQRPDLSEYAARRYPGGSPAQRARAGGGKRPAVRPRSADEAGGDGRVLYDAVFAGVRHFRPRFGGDMFEVRKEAEERGTSMNLFDILGPVMVGRAARIPPAPFGSGWRHAAFWARGRPRARRSRCLVRLRRRDADTARIAR